MKQLLFRLTFVLALLAENSHAAESNSKSFLGNYQLTSGMNICCSVDISTDQLAIEEQESNEIDGFNFFVEDPEVQLMKLDDKGFFIHPVVLFSPQYKVITLVSDLPPPRIS